MDLILNQIAHYERGAGTAAPTENQHQILQLFARLYHVSILFGEQFYDREIWKECQQYTAVQQ